jgi:MFS family permease
MWAAELISTLGDQLARVALAVLVFNRTHSAALTGLTFALTYLPTMIGGIFLAGLGDRYPRRTVLIVADVVQAVLIGAMAIPGMPFWALCVLLSIAVVANGPYRSAQQALLPHVLDGENYVLGMSIRNITIQTAQLAGFFGGGVLIVWVSAQVGLGIDALTFLLSALLVVVGVRRRPAPAKVEEDDEPRGLASVLQGARWNWRDRRIRVITMICYLALFTIAPEALAAPFAAQSGYGSIGVGALMAADPIGSALGAWLFVRFVPEPVRVRIVGWLAVAAAIPLALCALHPGLIVAVILVAVSGVFSISYTMQAITTTARLLPDRVRAQGSGFATTMLMSVQGLGALFAGLVGGAVGAAGGIGIAGIAQGVLALVLVVAWRSVARPYDALAVDLKQGQLA